MRLSEVAAMLRSRGPALRELGARADEARKRQVGDTVTYVVNRNINFTNVCVKSCRFCAFAKGYRSEEAYFYSPEEVVRRAQEAWDLGATEVCLQAGLAPKVDGETYVSLLTAIKQALPDMHVHGFSPAEVTYGSRTSGWTVQDMLHRLQDAGLGSLPGTSAEILDDTVRRRISPTRISTAQWVKVIRSAHRLGIPTTSTFMFGHVETPEQLAAHLLLLRQIQRETGGITEVVPLSFVHYEAPLFALEPGVRPGPSGAEVQAVFATTRLVLGDAIPNLQASWVKEGPRGAQVLLDWGANDLGGTLMNESISTAAGAKHGQWVKPPELERLIRDAGRSAAQRTTLYAPLRSDPHPTLHSVKAEQPSAEAW